METISFEHYGAVWKESDMMKLNEMEINKTCKIVRINCKDDIKRRLLDLGMIKGTKITPVLISPSGDPKAFDIRGTLIAIREDDTKLIEIKKWYNLFKPVI